MTVETGSGIWDFNAALPAEGDDVAEGNNHLQNIKAWLKTGTFPNVNAIVNATDEQLNFLVGVTSAIQTQMDLKASLVNITQIPQNSKSADYTFVAGDAGKNILHPSADTSARTFTIPANASVAFPVDTAITITNQASAGVITLAITSDTMRLAGPGTTGSRTLAANCVATILKLTSTEWIISGSAGLT